jgi:ABC-type multidrug transport system ATPase subunit
LTLIATKLTVSLNGREILHGIDLEAGPGWFGVLGVNGSGKTTLLSALCARRKVGAGTIVWQGRDLTHDDAERARRFGFAPPLDTLPPTLTAGELIALAADLRGCEAGRPVAIHRALGLDALRDKTVGSLSSGMKQRVSLFCAFLGEPDVLLLDEPFNWLDPVAAYDLKREIRAWADHGRCVVTALHDVGTFVTRCDAGLLIHQGRGIRAFDRHQLKQGHLDPARLEDEIHALFPRDATAGT